MKRTQLYMDDALFRLLGALSQEKKTSISELVRQAVKKVYASGKIDRDPQNSLAASFGIWSKRKELPETDSYVRSLRQGRRAKRLKLS